MADYLNGLPIKLTAVDSEEERRRFKVVRTDLMSDVSPGSLILSAAVESGLCLLRKLTGESQEYNFGPDGLRIVPARR